MGNKFTSNPIPFLKYLDFLKKYNLLRQSAINTKKN